jgi:cysteinyl-tRNA synthetase
MDYFGYDVHFVMNVTDIDDKVCGTVFLNDIIFLLTILSRSSSARAKITSLTSFEKRRKECPPS